MTESQIQKEVNKIFNGLAGLLVALLDLMKEIQLGSARERPHGYAFLWRVARRLVKALSDFEEEGYYWGRRELHDQMEELELLPIDPDYPEMY